MDVNDVIMVEENGTRKTRAVEITISVGHVLSLIPYHGYAQDGISLEDIVDTRNTWGICHTPVLATQEMDTHVMYLLHFYNTVYS